MARPAVAIDRHVPDVSPPVRFYTAPLTHRLLPAPAAFAAAAAWAGVRARRRPAEVAEARELMRRILEHTPRAHEADALAVPWMREKSITSEMFWRPWLAKRSRLEGREHYERARAKGRGVILAVGHITPLHNVFPGLAHHGVRFWTQIGPHHFGRKPPGYQGKVALQWVDYLASSWGPSHLFSSAKSTERIVELLGAGESVIVAFDAPGHVPTRFLGRTVGLAPGPARFAEKSGAVVVPVIPQRDGARTIIRLGPALDPHEHADVDALRDAVCGVFERHFIARPESYWIAWRPMPLLTEHDPNAVYDYDPVI